MIQVTPAEVTPALRGLFDPRMPTMPRAFIVLDGRNAGQILTDDPVQPTWGAIREATFGTLYLGGTFEAPLVRQLVDALRQTGDVVIGRWSDDPLLPLLPPQPDYVGWTLYFTNRPRNTGSNAYLRQVPPDCELRCFERSHDHAASLIAWSSAEQVVTKSLGFFLMRDDEILCEAATGLAALGRVEIGVTTHEAHRRRGYATITCARLIQACEELGYDTWWDCAAQNAASVALARKLGYRTEQEYRLLAWLKRPE